MTTAFTGTSKFTGIGGDCAFVTGFDVRVLIRAIDAMDEEALTIAMTPDQARVLAQGIIEAADRAEGKQ